MTLEQARHQHEWYRSTIWLSCSLDKTQVIFWNLRNSSPSAICRCSTRQLLSSILPSGIEPVPAFSLSYVPSQETFVNLCHITLPKDTRSTFKNYHSGSTKYCNRLKDQPLSKHHTVNLDGWPQVAKISTDDKERQPNECGSFPFGVIKDKKRL